MFKPHVTVATVVQAEGQFLVVEERVRGRTTWNQPAGHLEADETLLQAAVRELSEETGIDAVPQAFYACISGSPRITRRFCASCSHWICQKRWRLTRRIAISTAAGGCRLRTLSPRKSCVHRWLRKVCRFIRPGHVTHWLSSAPSSGHLARVRRSLTHDRMRRNFIRVAFNGSLKSDKQC